MRTKYVLITYFYIVLAIVLWFLRIRGIGYAGFLGIIVILFILTNSSKDTKKKERKCKEYLDSDECILVGKKSYSGLNGKGCIDIWHLFHFLMWLNIGLLAPGYIEFVFILSISWEIIEHFIFKKMCGRTDIYNGRIEDPLINLAGYIVGQQLSIISFKNFSKK